MPRVKWLHVRPFIINPMKNQPHHTPAAPPRTAGSLAAALLAATLSVGPAVPAANILWVSDALLNPGAFDGPRPELTDGGFIRLLQAAGHTITRFDPPDSNATLLTDEQIAQINTNDLVIIGRATASGQFQAGQGEQWNTNITKPLICMSPYLVRGATSGRMGWFDGANLPDSAIPIVLTAADPADAAAAFLLQDVDMLGATTADPLDELLDRNTSHITDPVVPGGRSLLTATFPTEGNESVEATANVIADFPAGTTVRTDPGGEQNVLAGYRQWFAGGSREGATAPNTIGLYTGRETLTPSGEKIFLRSVELALRNGTPPADASPLAVTRQPAGVTVKEGDPVRLSVAVSGPAPRTVKWQRDTGDGVTFADIADASTPFASSAYIIPAAARTDTGAKFRAVVTSGANSVNSDVVTLTVTPDNAPPAIVSAGSVTGATVDIVFDEAVDTATASDAANYVVSGATVGTATLRAGGRSVVLTLNAPVAGAFTVTVARVADPRGNAIPTSGATASGTFMGMTMTAIGTPDPEGASFALGAQSLEVSGGGLQFPLAGGASDQLQFVHKQVNGDFDARVRVASMAGDGRFESVSQAILTARESISEDAAAVSVIVTPPAPGDDVLHAHARLSTGDVTNEIGSVVVTNGLPGNAWLRLSRAGDVFTVYRSADGAQWTEVGNVTAALPATLEVGVGANSHRNTRLMTATFSNLQIGGPPAPEFNLVGWSYQGGAFTASFPTQNGVTYTPQYRNALVEGDAAWISLPTVAGDGMVKSFTDASGPLPGGTRFYRVSRP